MNTANPNRTVDLLDLAEFPMGLLAESRSPLPSVTYSDRGKALTITGNQQYGLPTARDVEVYLVLQQQAAAARFPARVPLVRHQILNELGWGIGSAYDRLELSLRRWLYTRYRATWAVHDVRTGEWVEERDFSVLQEIHERRRRGRIARDDAAGWFQFGPTIQELLESKFRFYLDTEAYLGLTSPLAQAEFRYLSAKRIDGKARFEQDLVTFANQHIGLKQQYPSKIKEKLAPAHAELIAAGLVTSVEYGTAQTGQPKIQFHFPRKEKPAAPAVSQPIRQKPPRNAPQPRTAVARPAADPEPLGELAKRFLSRDPDRAARFEAGKV